MDNFKKFIQENRQDLDLEKPALQVWQNIAQNLPQQKVEDKKAFPIARWVAAAACLLVVVCTAYFLLNKGKETVEPTYAKKEIPTIAQPESNNTIDNKTAIPEQINSAAPKVATTVAITEKKPSPITAKKTIKKQNNTAQYVIADVEVGNFTQLIDYQKQYISTLPIYGQKPSYFNDFKQQLKQMDADEKDVRNDIKKHGLNSNQIELLINIYQQKITLLKQLNQAINRINKSYSQTRMQKDSTKSEEPQFLNL